MNIPKMVLVLTWTLFVLSLFVTMGTNLPLIGGNPQTWNPDDDYIASVSRTVFAFLFLVATLVTAWYTFVATAFEGNEILGMDPVSMWVWASEVTELAILLQIPILIKTGFTPSLSLLLVAAAFAAIGVWIDINSTKGRRIYLEDYDDILRGQE